MSRVSRSNFVTCLINNKRVLERSLVLYNGGAFHLSREKKGKLVVMTDNSSGREETREYTVVKETRIERFSLGSFTSLAR